MIFLFYYPLFLIKCPPADAQQLNFVPFTQGRRKYSSMFVLVFSIQPQMSPHEFTQNRRRKTAVQKRPVSQDRKKLIARRSVRCVAGDVHEFSVCPEINRSW